MKTALFLGKKYSAMAVGFFGLGIKRMKNVSSWFFVGFTESNEFDEQTRDTSAFD